MGANLVAILLKTKNESKEKKKNNLFCHADLKIEKKKKKKKNL